MKEPTFDHDYWMSQAINCALQAEREGEVPVGAVLVKDNQLIASAWNCPISCNDPTAHAEVQVMRQGANVLKNYRLIDTVLYVTLEPCMMCAGAMVHARIKQLVYGAFDPRAGAISSVMQLLENKNLNHRVEHVGGVLQAECGQLLSNFFKSKR